ncbi:MAG TPA: hypothetical protein VML19_19505 [Verrucomicrobiae bacterium]|nr:hypothetical protein [Verrucomicrobiae bacterium]
MNVWNDSPSGTTLPQTVELIAAAQIRTGQRLGGLTGRMGHLMETMRRLGNIILAHE